ncbi:MAG: hypothetical protein AAGB11_03745 [Pseudomonadota bacterium]
MVAFLKRTVAPVIRLTTVQDVDHDETFYAFAQNVGRVVMERRVRDEPRVVSFPWRIAR